MATVFPFYATKYFDFTTNKANEWYSYFTAFIWEVQLLQINTAKHTMIMGFY